MFSDEIVEQDLLWFVFACVYARKEKNSFQNTFQAIDCTVCATLLLLNFINKMLYFYLSFPQKKLIVTVQHRYHLPPATSTF